MGRLVGEDGRSSKHLIRKEAICVNDERTCRIDHGELPLFFTGSIPLSSRVGHVNDAREDHKPGWPLGSSSYESGSWETSFRFELDGERLRAMVERDEQSTLGDANVGGKLTETSEGGSFRFMRNEELLGGHVHGLLKAPKQPGSFRFTTVFNANELQGYDVAAQSSGSLSLVPARYKAAVTEHVPLSPRTEVLRRLRNLKAHPSSPRFTSENASSYDQKEKSKIAIVRDESEQRMQTTVKNEHSRKGRSSSSISQNHCSVLSELEIMEIKERRRQSYSSTSELQISPRKAPQTSSPTTPTSRFKDDKSKLHGGSSKQERIVKHTEVVVSNINSPSPDHKPVGTPFKWEEQPGKPKTIAAAVDRALDRRLSREGIDPVELRDVKYFVESGNPGKGTWPEVSSPDSSIVDHRSRSGSHRYYGREYLRGLAREASLRRSSRRYSTGEKEALIDLDGSAAAKFLVEAFESPSRSHGSSPTFVVPFKWEDAPGKAKAETTAHKPSNVLQLPPRLAVGPTVGKAESLQKSSSPFSGFFLPCLTAGSPVNRDRALVPYNSSKSLPPRFPSPPERRRPCLGLVGRCSSTPREGCQIKVSKSRTSSSEKSLNVPPSTPAGNARNLSVSELRSKSNTPSSPTSILHGPEESNSQTSSVVFSSGDLEDFSTQTRKSVSKSSSSTSYEYAEEYFAEYSEAATSTSTAAEDTGLLNKQGAPTSSGYLNGEGKPLTLEILPKEEATDPSPEASPKRPSRLPYTMPEQLLASCSSSGRRQLIQDLSPRLLHQFSGRGNHSGSNTPYKQFTSERAVPPSPSYAGSLELFSPVKNQRRITKAVVAKSPPPRPRRRTRLMSSILKTLRRALPRKKRRRKRSDSALKYIER